MAINIIYSLSSCQTRRQRLSLQKMFLKSSAILLVFLTSRLLLSNSTIDSYTDTQPPLNQPLNSNQTSIPNNEDCEIPRLVCGGGDGCHDDDDEGQEGVTCHRIKPVEDSCKIADKLFLDRPRATCDQQARFDLCQLKEVTRGLYDVACETSVCKSGSMRIGLVSVVNGTIDWYRVTSDIELRRMILKLLERNDPIFEHHGFCLLSCQLEDEEAATMVDAWTLDDDRIYHPNTSDPDVLFVKEDHVINQILLLPPQVEGPDPDDGDGDDSDVSVNVVMLDSVSRTHFYRSLPETVKQFQKFIDEGMVAVLDYELFQAVKHRTFETLRALFTGVVKEDHPKYTQTNKLDISELLTSFKVKGYRTLWLEDTCWSGNWGLASNLVFTNWTLDRPLNEKWIEFRRALTQNGIDDIGPTLSSCNVLESLDRSDPFHGPPALCFNGRHQHDYLLEYLKEYQSKVSPYFTLYLSNIGHEDTGRRIQTMDRLLKDFVKFSSTNRMTVTVLMSDHGNSYGSFIEETSEGLVELYNPSLFVILPEGVRRKLGPEVVENLMDNRRRLVTVQDLHKFLKGLQSPPVLTSEYGLASEIPKDRTCDDVDRLTPNLCICDGYESVVRPTPEHHIFATYAVGTINNQLRVKEPRKCLDIIVRNIKQVKEIRNKKDSTTSTKLEVSVTTDRFRDIDETFLFSIVTSSKEADRSWIELESFERLTPYENYRKCANANPKTCLCRLNDGRKKKTTTKSVETDVGTFKTFMTKVWNKSRDDDDPCLVLTTKQFSVGASFELSRSCPSRRTLDVTFSLKYINMLTSERTLPLKVVLGPEDRRFLMVVKQDASDRNSTYVPNAEYSIV